MEDRELEDLDQLVKSAGWSRFLTMVDKEWGRGSDKFHDAVVNASRGENTHAADHLRQIIAAQREIQNVMQMVPHRLKQLQDAQKPGPVLAMSRRGGL